jgi:hypothetical protein
MQGLLRHYNNLTNDQFKQKVFKKAYIEKSFLI